MTESSIEKIMIRHEKEAESEYKEFPVKLAVGYEEEENLLSQHGRRSGVTGEYTENLIGIHPKITLEFKDISTDTASIVYKEMIMDKTKLYGSRFFYLNIPTTAHGWISGLFYLGTPNRVIPKVVYSLSPYKGKVDMSLTFISVEGFDVRSGINGS